MERKNNSTSPDGRPHPYPNSLYNRRTNTQEGTLLYPDTACHLDSRRQVNVISKDGIVFNHRSGINHPIPAQFNPWAHHRSRHHH